MTDAFEINVSGIAELQRAIYKYNARLGERVTRASLRAGASYMLKHLRNAAPVKTGRLKKAIRIKNSRINRINKNGKVGIYITISAGKNRKDPRGAYYAKWVENGYMRGSKIIGKRKRSGGVRVEGKHFVEKTFKKTSAQTVDIIVRASELGAKRIAQELRFK